MVARLNRHPLLSGRRFNGNDAQDWRGVPIQEPAGLLPRGRARRDRAP
jgi:hypothetical protein